MFIDLILIAIGLAGIIIGSITDIRKREVADFVNYFMIISGLGIRLIYSISTWQWNFFFYGVLGFISFLFLAHIMFFTGQWGGGDGKMLMGMGALFATYPEFLKNYFSPNLLGLPFLVSFWINLLILGAVYGMLWTLGLGIVKHKDFVPVWKKKIKNKINITKNFSISSLKLVLIPSIILFTLGIFSRNFIIQLFLIVFAIIILVFFFMYTAVKSIEKSCMYKTVDYSGLVEGDWLLDDIIIEHDNKDNFQKKFKKQFHNITENSKELNKKYIEREFIASCFIADKKFNIIKLVLNIDSINEQIEKLSEEIHFDFKTEYDFLENMSKKQISFMNISTIKKVLHDAHYYDSFDDVFMLDYKDYFIRMEFLKLCYSSYSNFFGKILIPFRIKRFKKLLPKIKFNFDRKEDFIEYFDNLELPFLEKKIVEYVLTEELLYDDTKLYVAGKKATGLNLSQIKEIEKLFILKRINKVKIRHGIPFVPSFLFALVFSLIFGNIAVFLI